MDQDQVPASPPSTSSYASILAQRYRRRENPPAVRTENQDDLGNIAAEVAHIYNADRQDSLHALRTRRRIRTVPATSEFICMEDLLRTQAEPAPGQEIVDMILRDFCSSPTYEEEEDLPTCESPPWFRFRRKKIRTYVRKRAPAEPRVLPKVEEVEEEEDDRLSCSSGLSVQEDHTAPTATATTVCELDANTSKKICENLLNLSEYFSLSNPSSSHPPKKEDQPPAVCTKIDLPPKVIRNSQKPSCSRDQRSHLSDTNSSAECTAIELENLEVDLLGIGFTFEASEVCDIKPRASVPGPLGDTFFGDSKASTSAVQCQSDSKVCADWSEGDSLLENYNTEKMSLSEEELEVKAEPIEVKSEIPQSFTQSVLDDIPISEWQTAMDIPEDSIEETQELPQEAVKTQPSELISQRAVPASTSKYISDAEFLREIPLDEWQPMEIPEFVSFRTASDKPIVISEEMQERAAKLLADVEEMEPQTTSEFVGFRTASNKPIEITEEMESKGAMFIAQFKVSDQQSQPNEAEFLQGIAFSEWQPIDMPEKPEEREAIAINHQQQPETKTPNKSQSLNIPQLVAFRKTPYKFMEVAEEMKIKGDKLMAEVESGLYQPSQRRCPQNREELPQTAPKRLNELSEEMKTETKDVVGVNSEFVGFRTASNKAIVVSEEMKIRAAQFMAEFQIGGFDQEEESVVPENSEFIGFRTASNKPIVVSEEMKTRAAQLMAEFEAGGRERVAGEEDFVGFRTASNKAIVVSEAMKNKAAKLLAEVQAGETPGNIYSSKEKVTDSRQPEENPEFFGFQTASSKRIEISEMKKKAAKLMAEVQAESVNQDQKPTSDIESPSDASDNVSGESFKGFPETGPLPADEDLFNDSVFPRRSQDDSRVSTPRQRRDTSDGIPSSKRLRKIDNLSPGQNPHQSSRQLQKTTSCDSAVGTPSRSQEIHASLTQLAGLSPLDPVTKTSVIARRNLLTLSKRRKRSRTPTGTPLKSRLAAIPASTSTPLADRNTNLAPKQSEEDMSPICMPPNKSRRLGLSRSRY